MYPDVLLDAFRPHFDVAPALVVRAPGRINLIGEHTDYNEGFVLPAAIDRAIWFVAAPRDDQRLTFMAHDLNDSFSTDLQHIRPSEKGWPNYLLGVFSELQKEEHPLRGIDLVFGGDIPPGAGLSSSAALESGLLLALNDLFALNLSRPALARLAQRAENHFVGANCGIMDMYACLLGREGHALHLDCRSLEADMVPLYFPDHYLVLCDSGVKHALVDSPFNQRRAECEQGVQVMAAVFPNIKTLRDATPDMLLAVKNQVSPIVFQRCQYVLAENARVAQAVGALRESRADEFGALLYASHAGLQQQFEVSCPELDFLVEKTESDEAVAGARMMGGGFGGCTINLVQRAAVKHFQQRMQAAYEKAWGYSLYCFKVEAGNGAMATRL